MAFDPHPELRGKELLEQQFTVLTELAGGEGQGLSFLNTRDTIKGIDLKFPDLAADAALGDEPILYHTRRSSVGAPVDQLCQPFTIHPYIVAHNGHWNFWLSGLEALLRANKLKFVPYHMSDSLVGSLIVRSWGPGTLYQYEAEGVWLVSKTAYKGGPGDLTAIVNSGDLAVNLTTGQAASVPIGWDLNDQIGYVKPGSVIKLWPKIKLVTGSLLAKPYQPPKKGKKRVEEEVIEL
jgi:hypothetical protein